MATFVVLLTYRGAYKGMVGPFDEEAVAGSWAAVNAPAADGWTWAVEPLVDPEGLSSWQPRRPQLRVVS